MKKKIKYFFIIALISAGVSCTNFQDEDVPDGLTVDPTVLSFSAEANSRSVTVRSGYKWDVSSLPEWMGVQSIDQSSSRFEWNVSFSASANNDFNREGSIVLKARSETVNVAVTQEGKKGKYVAVESVSLSPKELSLTEGDEAQLTAEVSPSNASIKDVTWESSSPSVATVDETGRVSAVGEGTAVIAVTTEDGNKTATCSVEVKAKTIPVTSVSLDETSISMTVGDTQTLTATISPSNATDKSVTWSSSNTSIATVSSSGLVTAKAVGSATITVTTSDGSKTATCSVTVKEKTVPVTGVSLDKTSLSLSVGDTQVLTATVAPSNATDKSVIWSSSNTSVASVSSSGVVTAKSVGSATITVTTNDGSKTATCSITVVYPTPAAIDLGLSVKWASFNVGAAKPEDTGYYFPWGETQPVAYNYGDFFFYTLDSYKWYNSSDRTLTKYCPIASYGHNGYTDNKSILDQADDAAYVNLGTMWRMPTSEEFLQLKEKCTWKWTSTNGVNGYKVTGPNGNSIFLPATGFGTMTEFRNGGTQGYYWSASLRKDYPYYAYSFGIGASSYDNESRDRSSILPIRPVSGAPSVSVTGVSLNKTSLTMTAGDAQTLTATVSPSNATDKSVTWSSSNTSVATVSSSGVVTAKSAGTAKITVKTNDGAKTATCTVTVKAAKVSVTGVSLNKTSLSMAVGDTQTLTATVSPSNATDKSVTWSSSNTSVATVSSLGVVTAKTTGSATITVKTNDGGKTATCSVTVSQSGYPEAVDLGLPSGIKWASFNLGASKPEEFGDYYAWGDPELYYSSLDPMIWKEGKESGYSVSSYKWFNGDRIELTKYCTSQSLGYNGFTDGKTVLDLEDDSAYMNLGGNWRMPTKDEWAELMENCTWTWTTWNGVAGRLITARNGNSIFLPAAGFLGGTDLSNVFTIGYYWSSYLFEDEVGSGFRSDFASPLCFTSGVVDNSSMAGRCYGFSIRPVYAE